MDHYWQTGQLFPDEALVPPGVMQLHAYCDGCGAGVVYECWRDSLSDTDTDERELMRALDPHAQAAFVPSKQPAPGVLKQHHRTRIVHSYECPARLMEKVLRH